MENSAKQAVFEEIAAFRQPGVSSNGGTVASNAGTVASNAGAVASNADAVASDGDAVASNADAVAGDGEAVAVRTGGVALRDQARSGAAVRAETGQQLAGGDNAKGTPDFDAALMRARVAGARRPASTFFEKS